MSSGVKLISLKNEIKKCTIQGRHQEQQLPGTGHSTDQQSSHSYTHGAECHAFEVLVAS